MRCTQRPVQEMSEAAKNSLASRSTAPGRAPPRLARSRPGGEWAQLGTRVPQRCGARPGILLDALLGQRSRSNIRPSRCGLGPLRIDAGLGPTRLSRSSSRINWPRSRVTMTRSASPGRPRRGGLVAHRLARRRGGKDLAGAVGAAPGAAAGSATRPGRHRCWLSPGRARPRHGGEAGERQPGGIQAAGRARVGSHGGSGRRRRFMVLSHGCGATRRRRSGRFDDSRLILLGRTGRRHRAANWPRRPRAGRMQVDPPTAVTAKKGRATGPARPRRAPVTGGKGRAHDGVEAIASVDGLGPAGPRRRDRRSPARSAAHRDAGRPGCGASPIAAGRRRRAQLPGRQQLPGRDRRQALRR